MTIKDKKKNIISERYKVQYEDRMGNWNNFGPFLFSNQDTAKAYYKQYKNSLGQHARIIKVTEEVIESIDKVKN
jgi:hypothetical protein